MNKNVLKPILGGILLGAFVYFTGPLLLIVFLLKFIFTPFGMARMGRGFVAGPMGFNSQMRFAMADKIRNMSEEDYDSFKEKMNHRFGNCQRFNQH
jgi:hypothetical protein